MKEPMKNEDVFEICHKAIVKYGTETQLFQLLEESCELVTAINHWFRKRDGALEELIEEAADVAICLCQLECIFASLGVWDKFKETVERKAFALEARLNAK